MEDIKRFILNLTVVCLSLQIGNIFIPKEKYRKLYGIICAIIIISMILKAPVYELKLNSNEYTYESEDITGYSDSVKEEFLENINVKLQDDIYTKFGIESKVESDSDFQRIVFDIILYNCESDLDEISNYVRKNYCTENDEVYIKNEYKELY